MISLSNTHYNIKTANGNTKIVLAHFLIIQVRDTRMSRKGRMEASQFDAFSVVNVRDREI